MRKVRILLFTGMWVALLPYLGFPIFWKNILLSISGLGLIYVSYLLYKEVKLGEEAIDTFSENTDWNDGEIKSDVGISV